MLSAARYDSKGDGDLAREQYCVPVQVGTLYHVFLLWLKRIPESFYMNIWRGWKKCVRIVKYKD